MKIIFLGTNGWYDTEMGNTICILVQTDDYHIILDAGNGICKSDEHIRDDRPVYLFLSHFHLDHIIGLHILAKFDFRGGLHICGPKGSKEILGMMVNLPFSMPLERLRYRTFIHELPDGKSDIPFGFECLQMLHSSLTLGYRFTFDGKTLAYCPDTGYCENAVELGRNADLLITECAFRPGETSASWPHLNPESAAHIALKAGARRLALVHFDASRYRSPGDREEADAAAKTIFPASFASSDGMTILL